MNDGPGCYKISFFGTGPTTTGISCLFTVSLRIWHFTKQLVLLIHSVKFQKFSAIQILRELNFGDFEDLKTVILTILAAQNFDLLAI